MIKEFEFRTLPGIGMLVLLLGIMVGAVYGLVGTRGEEERVATMLIAVLVMVG